jgi:hypothetical protein
LGALAGDGSGVAPMWPDGGGPSLQSGLVSRPASMSRRSKALAAVGRRGRARLAKASKTEPAVTRARLSERVINTGMAGLAVKVPPADLRVRERALASLK